MTFDRLIRILEDDAITTFDFLDYVGKMAGDSKAREAELLDRLDGLTGHPSESVRYAADFAARHLREFARLQAEQVKDIEVLRRTSPLQPGARLSIGGGYTAAYRDHAPSWLGGREHYRATFLGFAQGRAGAMPVALVEFDDEVVTHLARGRYGVLKLLFVANWTERETVVVHVLGSLPEDVGPFCDLPRIALPSEVETHATYIIITDDRDAT